jgi:predicted ribosomally synthesized peptide with nif11-like leader
MSAASEIERFAKDTLSNDALRAEVKALGADQEAILALANAKGYRFTMEDVTELGSSGELSDEQLAAVAGGAIILYSDGETTLSGGTRSTVYTSGKKTFVWLLQ